METTTVVPSTRPSVGLAFLICAASVGWALVVLPEKTPTPFTSALTVAVAVISCWTIVWLNTFVHRAASWCDSSSTSMMCFPKSATRCPRAAVISGVFTSMKFLSSGSAKSLLCLHLFFAYCTRRIEQLEERTRATGGDATSIANEFTHSVEVSARDRLRASSQDLSGPNYRSSTKRTTVRSERDDSFPTFESLGRSGGRSSASSRTNPLPIPPSRSLTTYLTSTNEQRPPSSRFDTQTTAMGDTIATRSLSVETACSQ